MDEKQTERLKEIMGLAVDLGWVDKTRYTPTQSYPFMQASEVEKCMCAMVDDFELSRMHKWVEEQKSPKDKIEEYRKWLNEVQKSEYEGLRRSHFLEKFTEIFQSNEV